MKNSLLFDDEFLAAFESATLTDFHHVDHIRAAWIYLRRLPFSDASQRMAESVRHFAAKKGAHQKYHETITQAWMLLVVDALERDRQSEAGEKVTADGSRPDVTTRAARASDLAPGFDAFAAAHPNLLDVRALDRFYSSPLLASPAARTGFVAPDLSPLPSHAHNPQL
jgi:hypothetical protein